MYNHSQRRGIDDDKKICHTNPTNDLDRCGRTWLVLFLPANTMNYWQAWVFIVVFLAAVDAIGLYLSVKDPALLERRKQVGPAAEQSPAQKIIMTFALIGNLGLLIFCALDHRFGWSPTPAWVSILGDALVALGLLIDFITFKENSFGASNIRTEEEQRVISSGPYAVVRYPMYGGVLVMMSGVPLALGSFWGLAVLVLIFPALVWRILDEEELLKRNLPGYIEYTQKVRYRLVPYVW